jgi:hypothetical protein
VRVALDELGPLGEPGVLDVPAPGLDLRRILLQREDAPAEVADAGGEPDRGVAARAADLEHLAACRVGDEREEEPPRRRRDGPRPLHGAEPALAFVLVLALEPLEGRESLVVEH